MTNPMAETLAALASGGVVVIPTDTVYGLAALARRPAAVARLYELKGRPLDMPIGVLVDSVHSAAQVGQIRDSERAVATEFWPGPLTLVVPAVDTVSFAAADGTIGIRCPDHDLVRTIARQAGPLATTSANRHGMATPAGADAAAACLTGEVDAVVDFGPCSGEPSTVASLGPPVIIYRAGPIDARSIEATLNQ